ncbi:hypothetical protein HYT84_00860 [Candidatus Micrarchaeota archaeon]|nr:hypothetical protein [Candidatus Micrarchaeota archaeon]
MRKDPRIQAGRIIDAGLIVQTRIGHHESVLRIERLDGKIVEVPYIVTR